MIVFFRTFVKLASTNQSILMKQRVHSRRQIQMRWKSNRLWLLKMKKKITFFLELSFNF